MKSKVKIMIVIALIVYCNVNCFTVYANDKEEVALGGMEETISPTYERLELTNKASLPTSVDLSNDDWFPCIRNQGSIKSCCAWASTYYQFGYQVARMHNWDSKTTTSKQFSPKFTYNIINNGINQNTTLSSYYPILKVHGAVKFNQFTPLVDIGQSEYTKWYTNLTGLTTALENRVSEHHYSSFASSSDNTPITSPSSSCLNAIKTYLNSGHILTFITEFGQNNADWIYSTLGNGEKVCIQCVDYDEILQNHAMSIVGYDDTIWYDYNGDGIMQSYEKGALKIANSHGISYGNSGFIWVMYDALNKLSNYSGMNVENRKAIIPSYSYHRIEVEECDPELIAEVELTQTKRNQIRLNLEIPTIYNPSSQSTLLSNKGGAFPFGGYNSTINTATFPFDFGTLIRGSRQRMNYCISVRDWALSDPTTISKIKFVDKTGKIVTTDSVVKIIDNQEKRYYYNIGMMGDIDNNGTIDYDDVNLVQQYIANLISLTNEQLIVADVNGDGNISIADARNIQKMYYGLITEFDNGMFAFLG